MSLTDADVDRLGRAIMRAATAINSPNILDDLSSRRWEHSLSWAKRYATAVIDEWRIMKAEKAAIAKAEPRP
jgi:hypothetical protein